MIARIADVPMQWMKRFLFHLTIPFVVAIYAIWSVARAEHGMTSDVVVAGTFGFLFYCAPHCLWAAIAFLSRASASVTHSGFIAASFVLIGIATYPLYGRADPSGLPYQWLAYWPFALGLQLLTVALVAVANGTWRSETAAG
jgi:hypothetical protein